MINTKKITDVMTILAFYHGIINNVLVFNNTDHLWAASGNLDAKFIQAIDFFSDFLFPLLPCNNTTAIININSEKQLVKIVDILGRETNEVNNTTLFYIYNNGEVEKRIILE